MTMAWVPDPPDARVSEATCRGCAKPISRLATEAELWEDAAGMTVCVKARLEDIGHGQRPDYVLHTPMPAGLRGGPQHDEGEKTDG